MAGLNFQAPWPLPGSTAKGNNHSCVVRIDDGRSSILLTGDIERQAEQAMISRYWRHLTPTLIQVPHHCSNTLLQRAAGPPRMARPRWPRFALQCVADALVQGGSARPPAGLSLVRHAAGQITVVFPQKGGKSIASGSSFTALVLPVVWRARR